MVTALRPRWKLCEVLPVVGMAKSGYEYARSAQAKGETEGRAAARKAVIEAFEASGGTYGYRRVYAQVNADAGDGAAIGEWTVRGIMEEENLAARVARKKRRYSSYEGEISEAPENLLRDERGRHRFHADKPNELWITDVTEFRIPAGKACLSPIADCFDGMPLSWSISTSPDAGMANSSLLGACKWLNEGRSPQDPLGSRLSLSPAWMDKDMRRERPGQVDVEEGVQPRQREVRGLLRKIEDRVLPRPRLGRGHDREVHGHARCLPQMVQGCQDKGRPGLQEPHAVPQGLGSAGSVGWIRSRITTAVPNPLVIVDRISRSSAP